ncbi:MAG: hypothetical protein NTY36_10405 [Deltaproteobacteria bacterium]|nr:hypothetical protein [Deltaproteobacteria bacterium]
MTQSRYVHLVLTLLLVLGFSGSALAQTQTPPQTPTPTEPQYQKSACGPDHKIIYKRAVTLLDNAEKKLTARYTAEAKSMAKEAKSLFAILQKECGQDQKERALTPKEEQQEAINQKLSADEQSQAERLLKSAEEKFKKAQPLEAGQPDMYTQLMRQVKDENEQAQKRGIKAMIYAMRTQQMLFSFLSK